MTQGYTQVCKEGQHGISHDDAVILTENFGKCEEIRKGLVKMFKAVMKDE
jgi:hypothetical protein